jgi:hypothetical protein
MSIEKFKTFETAKRALWCFEPDAEYYRRIAAHFKLARKLCSVDSPKGVFKYRSISAAKRNTTVFRVTGRP